MRLTRVQDERFRQKNYKGKNNKEKTPIKASCLEKLEETFYKRKFHLIVWKPKEPKWGTQEGEPCLLK